MPSFMTYSDGGIVIHKVDVARIGVSSADKLGITFRSL